MFYFKLEEEYQIRQGIKATMKDFGEYFLDERAIFLKYQKALKELDDNKRALYLDNVKAEASVIKSELKSQNKDTKNVMGLVYGRDAYLLHRAEARKLNCSINSNGRLIYEDISVTFSYNMYTDLIISKEKMIENKQIDELGEDSEELPNIDDYYG